MDRAAVLLVLVALSVIFVGIFGQSHPLGPGISDDTHIILNVPHLGLSCFFTSPRQLIRPSFADHGMLAVPRLIYGTAWKQERTKALTKRALEAGT